MSSALAKAAARWRSPFYEGPVGANDCPPPRRVVDIASAGVDEYLQGFGGSPAGFAGMGLRIPTQSTVAASLSNPLYTRYLLTLASTQIASGNRRRLRGIGQYLTIGTTVTAAGVGTRVIEQPVMTPGWHFDNGNVSWHLHVHSDADIYRAGAGPYDTDNFMQTWCPMGLTYQSASFAEGALNVAGKPDYYTTLTGYAPPKNGRPPGSPLIPGLGTFYDVRFPWNFSLWDTLDLDFEIEGPCWVSFFASVRQRDTTATVPATSGSAITSGWGGPEEAFLQNFPNAIYWKVGGRLVFEDGVCATGGCDPTFYGGDRGFGGGGPTSSPSDGRKP